MNESQFPQRRADIRVRDPFVVADAEAGVYRLYAQMGNHKGINADKGVQAYSSPDLENWSRPTPVLDIPQQHGVDAVWAPEVHRWQGKWYILATLTLVEPFPGQPPVASPDWPKPARRGTHVFVSNRPLGPFTPLRHDSLTPPQWMALDGTLYVEDGIPWLVFCHEWVQVVNGRMMAVQLAPDLGSTVGEPIELFLASAAPGVIPQSDKGMVTDGPFLHRTAKGMLLMLWSTFIPGHRYSLLTARSQSGRIAGPWGRHTVLAGEDGGHGMIFRSFDGQNLLALHRPNTVNVNEYMHLFVIREDDDRLSLANWQAGARK